jgi:hypothetical protein
LGAIDQARVHFTINPATRVLNSDTGRFTCDQCHMTFDDGATLQPLIADPANPLPQVNIPMEGRLLFDLGLRVHRDVPSAPTRNAGGHLQRPPPCFCGL